MRTPPVGRGLFHAGGDVDGEAANAALRIDAAAEQHTPGVHADADVEIATTVAAQHEFALAFCFVEKRQAGAHGALRIVLTRCVGAEDGQQAVAGVIQNLAVGRVDDGREARQCAVHHGVDLLGVEVLAQRGGADDVEEQDRDLLQRLGGRLIRSR